MVLLTQNIRQLEASETEIKQSEVFSVLADSTEAEVCGIVLALDMAIQYFPHDLNRIIENLCLYYQTAKLRLTLSSTDHTDVILMVMSTFYPAFDLTSVHLETLWSM